jgi:hypothetical protein
MNGIRKKVEFDTEVNQKKQKLTNFEKQTQAREENIEKKFDLVIKKEKENKSLKSDLQDLKKNLECTNVEDSKT